MNKRRLTILSFSLICLVLIIGGFLYRYSEQLAEEKLQDYIKRLEDAGFAVKEHSLADFHVVVNVQNKASQRILEKAGFKKEGTLRKALWTGRGKWTDGYLYSILKEEWKEPKVLTKTASQS